MATEEMKADTAAHLTSKDFALFLVALLNGASEELQQQETSPGVAGPSPDPANRLPALD